MSVLKLVRSSTTPRQSVPWLDSEAVRRMRLDSRDSCRLPDGDPKAKGLKLRKQGAKLSFIFEAKAQGRTVAITLGSADVMPVEEAREQARKLRKAVDQGKDPAIAHRAAQAAAAAQDSASRESDTMTLRHVINLKMASGIRPHTAVAYRGLLSQAAAVNLIHLADRPLASISKLEWRAVLAKAADVYGKDSPKAWTIKRSVAALYRHALSVTDHLQLDNPIASISVAFEAKRRTDRLEAHQLAGWFARLRMSPATIANLAKFYLLTGLRDMEARGLRWSEVEADCIRIPAERMKAGKEHILPRTYAIDILLEAQGGGKGRSPYVFHAIGDNGKSSRYTRPISSILPMLKQLGCTTHGMRRTVATFLDLQGVPENIRRHILAQAPDVARGYVQRDLSAMRQHLTTYHQWLSDQRREGEALEAMMAQADEPSAADLAEYAALEEHEQREREQLRREWL